MASTKPRSPNLGSPGLGRPMLLGNTGHLWSPQPSTEIEVAGELSPMAFQPHPVTTPSSFSPMVLPESVSFLGLMFLSHCVSNGSSKARETWAWSPPFRSLFALMGWRSICSNFFFFKSTKTRPRKKTKSKGERATLLFKAPKFGVGGWCSSKRCGRRAPRGIQLVLQAPWECLWSGLGAGFSCCSMGPQLPKDSCVSPFEGLVQVYFLICVVAHVGACPYLSMFVHVGLLLGVGACVYIDVCMCLCVCVCACVHVFLWIWEG